MTARKLNDGSALSAVCSFTPPRGTALDGRHRAFGEVAHRNDAKLDHGAQSSHCKIGCTSPNAIALQNINF